MVNAPIDWAKLHHALGPATDVPEKLAELTRRTTPNTGPDDALWEWLLSALVHQGEVFPATFAATPEIIRACESKGDDVKIDLLWFIGLAEHGRQKTHADLSPSLRAGHEAAVENAKSEAAELVRRTSAPGKLRQLFETLSALHGQTYLTDQLHHIDYIPDDVLDASR